MSKKNVYMSVRVPQEMVEAAKRKARQLDRPLSQVMRELLRTWLAEQSTPVQAVK